MRRKADCEIERAAPGAALFASVHGPRRSGNIREGSSRSQVEGFRAKLKYQSGSTVQYQSVLIKDNSFRIGDSKFTRASAGNAQIETAITDPVTESTVTGAAAEA